MNFLRVIISLLIIVTGPIVSNSAKGADPILNPENGHYYKLIEVETGLNWNAARVSAEAMEYNLRPGYLLTITSSQEQHVIVDNFSELLSNAVWIGAEDNRSHK